MRWILPRVLARLDEALAGFNRESGKPYRLTCSTGVGHYDALSPPALDLLLQQLITSPRPPPLAVIDGLLVQLPLRASHWRRMAVLKQANLHLYQALIQQHPELQPAAEQEARLYY